MDERDALLAQLSGLQTPPVSHWPAIGWWLLALLLLVAIFGVLWLWQRHRQAAWRREARSELQALRATVGSRPAEEILQGASVLARRLLLIAEPRSQVAALHGEPWLERLDSAAGQPVFTHGFGRLLLEQPYQRAPQVPPDDLHALLDALTVLLAAIRPHQRPVYQRSWRPAARARPASVAARPRTLHRTDPS